MRNYVDGKLCVFVVLHPDPAFTGFWAGVDFCQGRGSTSSPQDVDRLVELGCRAEDPKVQGEAEARIAQERAAEASKRPSREAQAILESLPGYGLERRRPRRGR